MTPNEIDAMEAGRELDAMVAEKVMGWHKGSVYWEREMPADPNDPARFFTWTEFTYDGRGDVYDGVSDFEPSKSIAHAWQVIEALHGKKSYRGCGLTNYSLNFLEYRWHMEFSYLVTVEDDPGDDPEIGYESADAGTAPLAICRAALKAVLATIPT